MKTITLLSKDAFGRALVMLIIFFMSDCNKSSEEDPDPTIVPINVANQFTVEPTGGVFILPEDIEVIIPEGAVSKSKELSIEIQDYESMNSLAAIVIPENTSYIRGVALSTDQYDFLKPISIKIPVKDLSENGLPVLYELEKEKNTWQFSDESITVNNKEDYIQIELKVANQGGGRISSNSSFNDIRSFFLKLYGDVFLGEDECKKKIFRTMSKAIEKDESTGCEVKYLQEDISYLECDPPSKASYIAMEISSLCEPQVDILSEENLKVMKGEEISVNLSAHIGSLPQSGLEIRVSTNENIFVSKSTDFTDSEGKAEIKVKGIKGGTGILSISVLFDYYLSTVYASGDNERERNEYDRIQIKKEITLLISVIDKPEVATALLTTFTCESAKVGGEVIEEGNSPVSDRGIYLNGIKYSSGAGPGSFIIDLNDLEQDTEYTVRAFATNEVGTSYGEEIIFRTSFCSLFDVDGNGYKIVRIGEQVWMAENLKTAKYNDGVPIKNETDPWEWKYSNECYCWYNNDITNKNIYGAIYNFKTVESGKLCPIGWHVPSTDEYITLIEFVGGIEIGGGKLKEKGTTHWKSPNTGATDEYGFTALPGGVRNGFNIMPGGADVDFWGIGEQGAWLTSTEAEAGCFYYVGLSYNYQDGGMGTAQNCNRGASVRCIRD